jgi:hypothetical protein
MKRAAFSADSVHRLSVLSLVFIKAAAVDDSADDLLHVVGACRIGIDDPEQLLLGQRRFFIVNAAERRACPAAHLLHQ